MTALWNQRIFQVRVALCKMAIENEIASRSASTDAIPLHRIAGETIRQCLIILDDSVKDLPGYTSEPPIFPSSTATEDRVRPGHRHSRALPSPSAAETASDQVTTAGEHDNNTRMIQTPFPTSPPGAAQGPLPSSEAGA